VVPHVPVARSLASVCVCVCGQQVNKHGQVELVSPWGEGKGKGAGQQAKKWTRRKKKTKA
jgi:hypothetical protein